MLLEHGTNNIVWLREFEFPLSDEELIINARQTERVHQSRDRGAGGDRAANVHYGRHILHKDNKLDRLRERLYASTHLTYQVT